MTLIELLVFLAGVFVAVSVGIPVARRTQSVWLGIGSGLGATVCLYASCWGLSVLLYRVFPLRPVCRRGRCKSEDYVWDREDFRRFLSNPKASRHKTVFVCKCGDKYLRYGRRFSELTSDGEVRPYMVHPRFWRRWRPDEPPPAATPLTP